MIPSLMRCQHCTACCSTWQKQQPVNIYRAVQQTARPRAQHSCYVLATDNSAMHTVASHWQLQQARQVQSNYVHAENAT
jgi:hypothetical protein